MYDLKIEINDRFIEEIKKCNFLNELDQMVNDEAATLKIRMEDLKEFSKYEVVGVVSKETDDFKEPFEMKRISDKDANAFIVNIISDYHLSFGEIDDVIYNALELGTIKNAIYGIKLDDNLKTRLKVQVIYLYNESCKIEGEIKRCYNNDNDLVYDIALHFIDGNPIKISEVQSSFCLGLNKTLNIFERLEKLGIISSKSNNKRELLINNKEKIKELIY